MNNKYYCIVILAIVIAVTIIAISAEKCTPEIRYIPYGQADTIAAKELVLTKELLRRTQDSLNAYKCDTTISAELFVAKYKLERIRYYNNIAAKGNNIKYLRGWINRTLNE